MSDEGLEGMAKALRADFLRGFASPVVHAAFDTIDLLAIRVAGVPYALRMDEIAEVSAQRRVVPVPTSEKVLLGLAGIRGVVVPVYSLAMVLEHAPSELGAPWFAIHAGKERVALAFDLLERYVRVPRAALQSISEDPRTEHISAVVRLDDAQRAVVDIASIVRAIEARGDEPDTSKGR